MTRAGLWIALAGLALAVVGPSAPGAAQEAAVQTPLINVQGRDARSLDGVWRYALDPFNVPLRKPRSRRNFFEDLVAEPGGELIEYEWDSSPTIHVPADWNSEAAELTYYDGLVWYRRTFEAAPEADRRYQLYFEAVNYRARVWLNGQELGSHEGGFTPFAFDVTEHLSQGRNTLVLAVDNRHDDETLPARDFDWKNYGGITRPVWLVTLPDTYIHDYWLRLKDGRVVADVRLAGADAARVDVAVEVPALGLALTGRTDADGRVRMAAPTPADVALWSPESPTLYDVSVRAAGDAVADRVGLRTIAVRGRRILLNGAPVFLRGISIHEEAIGPVATRTLSWAAARALLSEARALGANFVRLAHYPHSERMVRLADEMGLLVWSEVPVYWEEVSYDSPATLALARRMKAESMTRDLNRASVIIWSVANETPIEDDRNAFLRTLIGDVRARDDTRLVSAALNKNVAVGGLREGEKRVLINDPLGADLDVIAVNQYEGWYGPRTPGEIAGVSFTNTYDKPLVFSEFGAGALYGHRGPRQDRWTEDYQAWLYDQTLKLLDRTDGLAGLSPWILKDFRSPRRWHGRFQNLWNRKGVIDERGNRKQAFHVLKSYYDAKAAEAAGR